MQGFLLTDHGDLLNLVNTTKATVSTVAPWTITFYHNDATTTAYNDYASQADMLKAFEELQDMLRSQEAGSGRAVPITPPAGLTIVSIAPNTGTLAGGTVCTITGTGFLGMGGTMFCAIGAMVNSLSVTDDSHMDVTTPDWGSYGGAVGVQDVQISYYHDLSAAQTLAAGFTYT